MAVGIDLGMIVTEVASLTAGERVRAQTRWYSVGMIAGTLGLSAAMNAFGFASQADTLPFQAAGVVFGVVAALALSRVMRGLLFGIEPTDPVTFVGVAVLLFAVALVACYVPARRAMRVLPMAVLRYQ